jgi:ATP-dependent helicase/nuclease subunit B
VTPDAGLARRVVEKLARWSITPSSSVGRTLSETPHGVFLRLLADLSIDDGEPIALLALLKHEFCRLANSAGVALLERSVIRGPRRWTDLASLRALAEEADAAEPIDAVCAALAPLSEWAGGPDRTLSTFADALAQAAEDLAVDASVLWGGSAGAAAAGLMRDLAEHGAALDELDGFDAARVIERLLAEAEAPLDHDGDPRIAIWGPLEARLQRRDLVILGGLNEGVWPAAPSADPFLARPMRERLGLPSPETRIGLAAHDFAQLANAPRVVMTRSQRRGAAPSVASRWIWRLQTLVRAAGETTALAAPAERDPILWARALDRPTGVTRLPAPAPKPPAAARLTSISFSKVETLIRDPYALYAARILGLEVLTSPGAKAGPPEKGTAVHEAIEAFADGADPQRLLGEIERRMAQAGFAPERVRAERARLRRACERFVAWSAGRAGSTVLREVTCKLPLPSGVNLTGRADRLDLRPDGRADIIDYKTGKPPTHEQVRCGLAPQLTLEAAALALAGFADAPAVEASSLIYWYFGGGDPCAMEMDLKEPAPLAAANALARLDALLVRYADPQQPFLSKPRAQFAKPFADYDHLARRGEWADAEEEEQ